MKLSKKGLFKLKYFDILMQKVIFNSTFLEYEGKKIFYRDIEDVSYIAESARINGIPIGTTYKFRLVTKENEISIYPKEKEWIKLINFSKQVIEPLKKKK